MAILFDSVTLVLYNTVMKNSGEVRWTIEELREAVAAALEGEGYDGPPNGRVRDVPDQRTIRYYTTLGLIDRAAKCAGERRFMAGGIFVSSWRSRSCKQRARPGRSAAGAGGPNRRRDARLAGLSPAEPTGRTRAGERTRREFWKRRRRPRGVAELRSVRSARSRTNRSRPRRWPTIALRRCRAFRLPKMLTLLLASSRRLTIEDLEALRLGLPSIDRLTGQTRNHTFG